MPCYDPRDTERGRIEIARSEFRHNSDVAELLCYVMNNMYHKSLAKVLHGSPDLQRWWRQHQERDRQKAEQEARARVEKTKRRNRRIANLEAELKELKRAKD